MAVSSCNQVGNRSDYDPDIERACHGYTNYFQSPSLEYRGYFKNIFCYICNGFSVSEILSCQLETSFVKANPQNTALLRVISGRVRKTYQHHSENYKKVKITPISCHACTNCTMIFFQFCPLYNYNYSKCFLNRSG